MFISVLSQKGGVCKSTIVRGLAVECINSGLDVAVADMDCTQLSCLRWAERREDSGISPAVPVVSCNKTPDALALIPDNDVVIADGTPYVTQTGKTLATKSDLVIIPTGISMDDLLPSVEMANEFVEEKKIPKDRIIMVVTKVPKGGEREAMQAKKDIQECGYAVIDTWLPIRTTYSQAMDRGNSICETRHPDLNRQAIRIFDQLGDYLMQQGER